MLRVSVLLLAVQLSVVRTVVVDPADDMVCQFLVSLVVLVCKGVADLKDDVNDR